MKPLLFLLFVLLAPWAHAQQTNGCQLNTPAQLALPSVTPQLMTSTVYASLEVECDAGVAYQVEVHNALSGGRVDLVASGISTTLPLSLLQSDSRQPWGALNQGEAIGGVGQGGAVSHPVEMSLSLSALPEPGVYRAQLDLAIVF